MVVCLLLLLYILFSLLPLRYEGGVMLPILFSGFPQHYIDVMLFASADVGADEIIDILDVQYDRVEPESFHFTELIRRGSFEHQKLILRVNEDGTRDGYPPDLLRRSNAEFLGRFLDFVTGSNFIPKYKTHQ